MGGLDDPAGEDDEAGPAKHLFDVLGLHPMPATFRPIADIPIEVLRLARKAIQPRSDLRVGGQPHSYIIAMAAMSNKLARAAPQGASRSGRLPEGDDWRSFHRSVWPRFRFPNADARTGRRKRLHAKWEA